MTASAAVVGETVADGDFDSQRRSEASAEPGIECPAGEFADDIRGVKAGFAYVDVVGVVSGIQIGNRNLASQGCIGFQLGLAGNDVPNGYINGLQMAGLENKADVCDGLQFSVFRNGASICNGLQIAAGLNGARMANGIQFAPFGNYAEVCNGLQVGLLANMSDGGVAYDGKAAVRGVQLCLLLNRAVRCDGLQACVLYNKAEVLHGLQLGLYNRAIGGAGVQIGFVNEFAGRTMPLLNFRF